MTGGHVRVSCHSQTGGCLWERLAGGPLSAPSLLYPQHLEKCLAHLFPASSSECPDRALQPRIIPTGKLSPPREASGCTAAFHSDLPSEGRQIPSRRRCVKIGFAARVKLCSTFSQLSPASETVFLQRILLTLGPSPLESV